METSPRSAGGEPASRSASKQGAETGTTTATAVPPPRGSAAAKKTAAPADASAAPINKLRRRLSWTALVGFLAASFLMFLRFFFPRTLFEPSSKFRIGYPSDFGLGVDERFKQAQRIWVVRRPDKLFVVYAKCTHLGCTPNWIETENKYKCPCHGSGYDMEGRNFEGPAPRPMDRAFVELDAEGQIVVDTSRLYKCPPGEECEFESQPNSFLVV
jgi:cytochrome b6-f complex iron-sulfur subunit